MDRHTTRTNLIRFLTAHRDDDKEAAELGIKDENGVALVQATGQPGYVYVRITRAGGGVTETTALNTRVTNTYGLKVWVRKNLDGAWAVEGIREVETVAQHGTGAALLGVPDAVTRAIVPASRVGIGRVVARPVNNAYTLSVYIYPFTYESGGVLYSYGGGWYDLTSHLPASSGQQRLALVCLDPATNQPTALNGDVYGLAVPLTAAHLAAFVYGDYIPLAGVICRYGMTAVDDDGLILDARPWFTGVETTPSAPGGTTSTWDPDLAPASPHASDDEFDDESLDGQWAEYDADSALTVTETAGGALRLALADGTSEGIHAVWMAPPDATYTIVVKVTLVTTSIWDLPASDGSPRRVRFGLVVSNDGLSTGPAYTSGLDIRQSPSGLSVLELNSFNASYWVTPAAYFNTAKFFSAEANGYTWYLRLRRSPTDSLTAGVVLDYVWRVDYSYDGLTWYSAAASSDTTFDAAAKVGVFLSNLHSGSAVSVDYEFFRYRASFDAVTEPCYGQSVASVVGHTHTESDITDLDHTDAAAIHDATAGEIHAVPEKTVLAAADELLLEDSAASYAKRRVQVGNWPLIVSTADVSNPPTDAELDSAFGTPATVGAGFHRLIDDNAADANVYLAVSNGTSWWLFTGTKAT